MPEPDPIEARVAELVYDSLRRMAERALAGERGGHTLQPTALVNEVWLRLAEPMRAEGWERERFLALAARTMRRALIDHARRRSTARRGGAAERVTLQGLAGEDRDAEPTDLLALDDALGELGARSPRQARVIELHWFGGLTFEEIGRELDVSDRTAKNDWRVARAWLAQRLESGGAP